MCGVESKMLAWYTANVTLVAQLLCRTFDASYQVHGPKMMYSDISVFWLKAIFDFLVKIKNQLKTRNSTYTTSYII